MSEVSSAESLYQEEPHLAELLLEADHCLGESGRNQMDNLAMVQSLLMCRGHTLRRFALHLQPKHCLILLVLIFFLLCPLWASLSFCGLGMYRDIDRDCYLYNFIFNMPMSLPTPAILLVILASFRLIAACQQPYVVRGPLYRVLARAPPLS